MRRTLACATTLLLAAGAAWAQVIPGEVVPPGSTVATTTDADSARVNMGAVPLARSSSARFTHVHDLRGGSALSADALTLTAPLLLGFAGSAGITYARPDVPAGRGHVVTGEVGLAYALASRLGVGARLRVSGASGPGLSALDGAAIFDLGAAWRPLSWLAFGVTGTTLLGPRLPALGMDRAVAAGIGLRPTRTDLFTLGLDASVAQSGTGWLRAGARVQVPYVGYLRAEAAVDLPSDAWRVGAGLDVVWGDLSAGGGAFFGGSTAGLDGPLGYYVTARVESERDRGLPEPATVVAIHLDGDPGERALARLLLRLDRLRRDPAVRGVVFAPRDDVGGLAHADELREAFARLRASGKRVACHLTEPTGASYYACTAADTVAMDPAGSLRMAGIRTGRYFLGDALRDVGVRTQFVRIGAWKSAPEQFTRRGSTPEGRAQEEQLLDDLYGGVVAGVARARGVDPVRARAVIEAGPYTATEARRAGLVDVLGSREVAERAVARALDARVVDLDDYLPVRARRWAPDRAVAVLYLHGDIVDGESFDVPGLGLHFVGDRTMVELIDQLAQTPRVGAIVLRVDSPGGSATASEMIWRALARAARHKPLVVSMGRIAASGGYYVAAPGREIFADPSTVTGSIGIFFGRADVAPLLSRLDVGVELLRRGPRADMDSVFRPFTDDELAVVSRMITESYNLFLQRVASGRHRTTAAIHAVGEGRVYAGVRASTNGLVDHTGGLLAAIDRARELGGLSEEDEVLELPSRAENLLQTFSSLISAGPAQPPTARLIERAELDRALGWLLAVAWAGQGRAMAMTEWPMALP